MVNDMDEVSLSPKSSIKTEPEVSVTEEERNNTTLEIGKYENTSELLERDTNGLSPHVSEANHIDVVTGDVAKKMRRRFLNIFARGLGTPFPPPLVTTITPRVHMGVGESEAKKEAYAARRRAAVAAKRRGAFHCGECGMVFKHRQYMRLHERACKTVVFAGKTEKTTCDCPECPAVLEDRAALAEHLRLHADDLFRCDVCGKGFEKLSKLTNHKVHHDRRLLRFQCSDCGRAFPLLSSLRRHQRRHPELRAMCPHCPKTFRFDCMLRRHLQTHATPSPVPAAGGECHLCGVSVASLKLHMRTHAWRSPHRCTPCGVFFMDEATLKGHMDKGRCDAAGRTQCQDGDTSEGNQDSTNRRFSERLRKKETE